MPWAEARLGDKRIKGAYAWRALLDSGATIASGSDFPVEEVPVLHGIYSAVTRQDRRGQPKSGWYPDQRMTLDEAVRSFTSAAAYAGFAEQSLGKLQKGYLADITVYDRKLEADISLHRTRVVMTIVGGQVVFERK
jgi:predicted amidohydrolase YtcJ